MKRIYLDHNASTPVHPDVIKAMAPFWREVFGNASSVHRFGQQARKAIENAREKAAGFIGGSSQEVFFTSGGTESDNLAIKGIACACQAKGKHIITSSIEHPAVLSTCKHLEKQGFKVTYLPVDKYGLVDPDDVRKAITEETILISIMYANNEVGTIEPIADIGKIAKERRVLFHTDAVQAVGKIPVNVNELNVDLLTISGHKIYGPKGVGALYVRKGTRIEPQIHGGHHEKNKRAGTENVPAIVGLGKAIEIARDTMQEESIRLTGLRNMLCSGISEKIEHVVLHGHPARRQPAIPGIIGKPQSFAGGGGLPNTLNVSFEFVEGESIILGLDMKGLAVSSGSACTSGSLEPSHVLKAMGVDPAISQGSIRFSLGRDNTKEDIDYVLEVLPGVVSRLRAMSPLYKK